MLLLLLPGYCFEFTCVSLGLSLKRTLFHNVYILTDLPQITLWFMWRRWWLLRPTLLKHFFTTLNICGIRFNADIFWDPFFNCFFFLWSLNALAHAFKGRLQMPLSKAEFSTSWSYLCIGQWMHQKSLNLNLGLNSGSFPSDNSS